MITTFLSAFIAFFVVIDPPGGAPIFYGLTTGASDAQRRTMAIRAVVVATIILLTFALVGEPLLHALGIDLDSFRIAGGIMLFFIAMEMVFEKRTARRESRVQRHQAKPADEIDDVSIFPMAMPMIAGPGSIATVMLLMAKANGLEASLVVLAAMAANLALIAIALLSVGPLMRVLGHEVEAVITRLLGVILAALAVQFVIDGLRGSHLF